MPRNDDTTKTPCTCESRIRPEGPYNPTVNRHAFLFALLAAAAPAARAVDYAKDIKPLLSERCYACHGALKQKAGLRLDTVAALKTGGDNGDATKLLLERLTTTDKDERMPPEGEGAMFNSEQLAKIREWLAAGAPGLANEQPEADPRTHWAYQPPKAAAKSLDALHAAHLAVKILTPQPAAPHEVWLRRVHFDLTGLPPSNADNQTRGQSDKENGREADISLSPLLTVSLSSPQAQAARAQLIDRLLASPQFGERWARHFMDIWRYCDWYGLGDQLRHSQKHIWHWRDWIIESLNADKGYDRMIVEQLAADELAPDDRANLRATGFLARSYYLFNRTTWLDETIEHTCRAFLGLTMQCVKCHDHKYDPVDHTEYYRLRAVFEPLHVRLDPLPGIADLGKDGLPRVFDLHLDRTTFRHVRGDEKNEDKTRPITPGVPAVLSFASFTPKTVALPKTAAQPALHPFVLTDQLAAAQAEIATLEQKLAALPKPAAKAPAAKKSATVSEESFFDTHFGPKKWRTVSGDWKRIPDEGIRQHETGMQRRLLELQATPPADFEASTSFTVHGGERYKSVGIAFDVAGEESVLVYLSAGKGAKLQIAPTVKGKVTYPAAGTLARSFKTGQRYGLTVRVRGKLVNITIDGQQVLAFWLTERREMGRMALTAFDADVEFHSFRLNPLSEDLNLAEPTAKPAASTDNRALLEKQLAAAKARPAMLRAVFAAQTAPADKKLAAAAAIAQATHKLLAAEAALAALDPKGDAKKLKAAQTALEAAQKKMKAPGESFDPLIISLKAQEGPDDANNTKVQTYPATSTGRRLAFAQWIADKRNPLTARVLVNQVWARLTGSSFVPDVSDFGRRAPAPAQQDMLDTLAAGFMENGWSLKWLIKQIVLSDLYRRSSSNAGVAPATLAADPDNTQLWRMNPRRLESQVVRDALLQLGGRLDLTLGGASIDPEKSASTPRRSLYFVQTPDTEHTFLGAFDNSNVLECYRRNESVVPQQALALTNSQLSRETADALAKLLQKLPADDFVAQSFQIILNRVPTDKERAIALESLRAMKENHAAFLQALLNHNDFVTLR